MKPILIIPPDCMSSEDIKALNDNGICTVVAKEPAAVKFVDPIPAVSSRTEIESAAIELSRRIMSKGFWNADFESSRQDVIKTYVEILVKGTPLDPAQQPSEKLMQEFEWEKLEETRRLARTEAKEEREAAKKGKLEAEKAKAKK